jgi:hypothetical protein
MLKGPFKLKWVGGKWQDTVTDPQETKFQLTESLLSFRCYNGKESTVNRALGGSTYPG